jgi:RND family efflux transporter MFP subunit
MRIVLWWMVLLAVGTLAGCDKPAPAAPPPPEVTVARPVQMDVVWNHDFTGNLAAIESVEIRARVEGFLQSIEFVPSAEVKAGETLFIIDPAPFQAALEAAEAELAHNAATLKQAKWDLERFEALEKREATTAKEVQDARTAVARSDAGVKAAQAQVDKARLDLSYTDIRSPIDGRVSRNMVDVGNLVGAGERTLLTTEMDELYAYFNVPEHLLLERLAERDIESRRNPNAAVFVGLANEDGFPHQGTLDYIDNTVDPATGTVSIRGIVRNDSDLLFPGAFVRIRIPGRVVQGAVLVSERAIGTDLGGKYLLLVNDENIVEHRRVTLGQLQEGMRVIAEGLAPDERYITKGLQRARPGLPVTPRTAEDAGTPGS